MPKPNEHPSKKPAWLLGSYILVALVVAFVIIFAVSQKHEQRPGAPAEQTH